MILKLWKFCFVSKTGETDEFARLWFSTNIYKDFFEGTTLSNYFGCSVFINIISLTGVI